jgi:RNA recognition motif-containing protein
MTEPNETVGEVSSEALTQAPTEPAPTAENGQNDTTTVEIKTEEKDNSKGPTPSAPNELKLYVGNLPDNCLRDDLETLFASYGEVSQCDRVKNFAFVVSIQVFSILTCRVVSGNGTRIFCRSKQMVNLRLGFPPKLV